MLKILDRVVFGKTGWQLALRLHLIRCWSLWHRLRYDLVKELVVALCLSMLIATYSYIFADFLQRIVAEVSTAMYLLFSRYCAYLVALLAGAWVGRSLRQEKDNSYIKLQKRLGVNPASIRMSQVFSIITVVVGSILLCAVITNFILRIDVFLLPFYVIGIGSAYLWQLNIWRSSPNVAKQQPTSLYRWRMLQIKRGQLPLFVIATLFAGLNFWLAQFSLPLPIHACLAMLIGLLLSFAIANQAAIDMQFAAIERNLSVSHADYMRTYEKIGLTLALLASILFATTFVVPKLLFAQLLYQEVLKGIVLSALAPLLMPLLIMQIDVRRPIIQYLIASVVLLFIGTAILATWYALILYPLLRVFALQITAGRFYRG
ncbi:MAG: hypothetical protein OYH77_07480 [Pseudomonadota bacterium]|nr:hypothetical protein [Pseudomonadota bacterium]